ncbi:hypothetical protein ED388_14905 [Muribaculaceae bacterium Isolate-007 (NCI)]|uniref:hypothetical protein n=1 Tax=Muribaculum intestinale TaxID=1796646 RepID=UPI000FFE6BBF|nr:hypothetical protein [Muribaculum intestinale]RXE63587.1 hypothetical protein ED388_14905 [Muribaculaceae bacterium Isolate-007 (NCI)]TGX78228.1 hypothetical protein E5360_13175 [Muribaculum intestinale]
MPPPMTFRDVVPVLEKLRQDIKYPQIAKSDLVCRKEIAENFKMLYSIDQESVVIETHALGEVGKILADTVRNLCAEIVCRIHTYYDTFRELDRKERSKRDDFDEYEIKHLLNEFELLKIDAQLYQGSLIARGKMPMPPDCTMNDVNRELFAYHLDEHRERWLKRKRKFLVSLQRSIEFDDFLDEELPPLYSRLRDVCSKLFTNAERYFPPCEIKLQNKLRLTFEQKMMHRGGSFLTPLEDIKKQTTLNIQDNKCWKGELFPMILISELYEVCNDVFDNPTETQFHSSLNLHDKHEPIRVRPKQTIKACYLVSKLYEIVPAKHKTAWREEILNHLGIEWSYYEKKYCHPRGSEASASSRAYADEVDAIFKKHKKRA